MDGVKKYHCDYEKCDKSYIRLEHLTRHQLNHKGFNLNCEVCSKPFTRNDLLQRHLQRHVRNQEIPNAEVRPIKRVKRRSSSEDHVPTTVTDNGNKQLSPDGMATASQLQAVSALSALANPRVPSMQSLQNSFLPSLVDQPFIQQISYPSPDVMSQPPSISPQRMPPPSQYSSPSWPQQQQQTSMWNSFASPLNGPRELQSDISGRSPGEDASWDWLFSGNGLFDEPFGQYLDLTLDSKSRTSDSSRDFSSSDGSRDNFELTSFAYAAFISQLPQELHAQPFLQVMAIRDTLIMALDSLDKAIPIFHRPTAKAELMSLPLLLVLVSYGFLISINRPDIYNVGLQMHQIARRILYDPDVKPSSSSVDLMFLQAMLIHEITGTFLGTRTEHEKADVLHGQLIALARRSSFLVQDTMNFANGQPNNGHMKTDEKWLEWARRESTKRLAHWIYMNDVQVNILYNHTNMMTVEDMRIAMPCEESLWTASSSSRWAALQSQTPTNQRDSRFLHRELITAFVVNDEKLLRSTSFSSLQRYIVIHGLLNMISKHAEKKSSRMIFNPIDRPTELTHNIQEERVMLEQALLSYERVLNQAPAVSAGISEDSFAKNSRILFRLAQIGLNVRGSDMEICAGAIFSSGRAVNHERVTASMNRMMATKLNFQCALPAVLNIEELCSAQATSLLGPEMSGSELIMSAIVYNASLTIWTYLMGVKQQAGEPIGLLEKRRHRSKHHRRAEPREPLDITSLCRRLQEEAERDAVEPLKGTVAKVLELASDRMAWARSGINNEFRSVIMSLAGRLRSYDK